MIICPMNASHKRMSSLRRQISLMLAGGLALLWSVVLWDYRRTEDQALEQIRRETAVLAMVFANHAETTFRDVDHALLVLRDAWTTTPERFAQEIGRHQDLLDGTAVHIAFINPQGYVTYSNLGLPKELLYVGDREFFQKHHSNHEDKLFISRPIKGRLSGKWSIQMTRPVVQSGKFAGVIVIAVDPDYFVKFYQQLGLGKDGAARMIRDTGEVMARSSDQDKYIGKVINTSPYGDPGASLTGSFRRTAQVDGIDRLSSYHRLPERGLSVIIGPSVNEMLAPTRKQQVKTLASAGFITLLVMLMSWQILRSIARNEKSQSALNEQQERLSLATIHNGVGIWDWNLQTKEMIWDDSMFALYHLHRQDFPGTDEAWRNSLHPDDRDRADHEIQTALAGGESFDTEFRVIWPDGQVHHIKAVAKVFRDENGKPMRMLGTNIDITDRKQAEEARLIAEKHARELVEAHRDQLESRVVERTTELSKAKEAAEAANIAKSLFLANVSHELRTPLNHITGIAHLVRREPLSPKQTERMDKLGHAADHLSGIIKAILETTKLEAGKLEISEVALSLDSLVGNVVDIFRDKAENKHLQLLTLLENVPSPLLGDPAHLQAALVNYVDNAIRFTDSGSVSIKVEVVDEQETDVVIRIEVEDTGIGIAPDVLPRLFTIFEQADNSSTRKYGGTGLGLAMTKKLAQSMGGNAGCHSVLGQGSTFWFTASLKKNNASS